MDCSGGSLKLVLFVGVILVSDLVATLFSGTDVLLLITGIFPKAW